MQICKNIFLVCGYPYSSIDNVYAIKTDQGLILVDTGTDSREYDTIMENLAYWDLGPVTHVIVTHAHINHCFNARRFQQNGAKIICSEPVADALMTASDRLIDYHNLSVDYNVKTFEKCTPDILVDREGDFKWGGLHFDMRITDGHSKGGLVFFCSTGGKRLMFTGDFLQIAPFNKHAVIGWEGDLEFDHMVYLEELKKLSNEEPDAILPGHYQQCLKDAWQMPKNAYVRAVHSTRHSLNPNVNY